MIQLNRPYLTSAERTRVDALAANRRLYEGRHREHFFVGNRTRHRYTALGPNAGNVLYITENLAGRCSNKYADLLFGQELQVEAAGGNAAAAAAIDAAELRCDIHPLLFSAAATASWAGEAWIVARVAAGSVFLDEAPPENVFPEYARGGKTLRRVRIVEVLSKPIDCVDGIPTDAVGGLGRRYVIETVHEPGTITTRAYRLALDSDVAESAVDLSVVDPSLTGAELVQPTGIAEIAVVRLPNWGACGAGSSDYGPETGELIDEVNNRRTQIARVLDKHAAPMLQMLERYFDERGNALAVDQVLAHGDNTVDAAKYITWDANLASAAAALLDASGAMMGEMDMAPELLGRGSNATSADSWKKYKLSVSQTLARVNRKRIHLSGPVAAIYRLLMLLENVYTPGVRYPVAPVTLGWSDGMPEDETEQMQVITGYSAAGLMSEREALLRIHGGDETKVAEEQKQLATEREARMPVAFQGGALEAGENSPPTPEGTEPGRVAPIG